METKKVGVVGCGFMGSGIAQISAQSGYDVLVSDVNEEILNKGLTSIDYYLNRNVEKGRMSQQEKDTTMARLKGTTNLQDFGDCDLVVEVVPENLELKKKVFAELDKICPKHAILTTNSSCLSIAELAAVTNRPEKVMGTHFISPVPLSPMVELVRPIAVSDETLETVIDFGKSLGKTVIVAKNTPGFIFNHMLMALSQAALDLLENGVATKEDIDASMTLGLGHPIGPLALMDFNGLDIGLQVTEAMYEQTKNPLFAPRPLVREMVAAGWYGRKTGKGIYDYK